MIYLIYIFFYFVADITYPQPNLDYISSTSPEVMILMKTTSLYYWNEHSIKVITKANAKKLWLDYNFDVYVDDEICYKTTSFSWLCSTTRFKVRHHNTNTYGQIISTGFPCTPVISQATILDNCILGHNQMWVKSRLVTYALAVGLIVTLV